MRAVVLTGASLGPRTIDNEGAHRLCHGKRGTDRAPVSWQFSYPRKRVYDVAGASKELGVPESTVRRMISDKRLRASRTCGEDSGRIVISDQALVEFLGDQPQDE